MAAIFVTGTDTGVGKTNLCGLLGRYLQDRGYNVCIQKWVQTGSKCSSNDIDISLRFMGKTKDDFRPYLSSMAPYVYEFASSPHLAAKIEGKRIDKAKIKRSFVTLTKEFDFVIVEGTGGVLVPFDGKKLLIDIVKELEIPVSIAAGNRLGAINHTLLTMEALKTRKIKIVGVIFNNILKDENKIILKDNPRIVKRLTGEEILGILPWTRDPRELQRRFKPIGDRIIARL